MSTYNTGTANQPMHFDDEAGMPSNVPGQAYVHETRLDLLYEVGRKAISASEVSKIIAEIVAMTRQTLKASASSVLLIDGNGQDLLFEFADGTAGGTLKQVKLRIESGIAGWVARHGKPLIVNDVTKDQRFYGEVDEATGFITRSILCAPLVSSGRVIGVVEVLNKLDGNDFSNQDLEALTAVAATAAIAIENSKLHQLVIDGYKDTIRALAAAIDIKDPYTCGHSQRVVRYSLLGGVSLSFSQAELDTLEYAAILHDIGKIAIDDSVLGKPGLLTDEESRAFRQHPIIGAKIIDGIPFLNDVKTLVLHHHEKYDGTGYPYGLKGEDIPLGARLLAVADAFDSMTMDRPYRVALSTEHTIDELHRCTGTQFCPAAAEAFISGLEKSEQPLDSQRCGNHGL